MPNQATSADVASRWRPLTDAETIVADTLLADAWRMIVRRIPDVEDRMADAVSGVTYTADVVMVQANAVMRVLKNPDGMRSESIDDYSWTRDRTLSAGNLQITDDEWELLGAATGTGGAFSIDTMPAEYDDTSVYPVSVTGIPEDTDWT